MPTRWTISAYELLGALVAAVKSADDRDDATVTLELGPSVGRIVCRNPISAAESVTTFALTGHGVRTAAVASFAATDLRDAFRSQIGTPYTEPVEVTLEDRFLIAVPSRGEPTTVLVSPGEWDATAPDAAAIDTELRERPGHPVRVTPAHWDRAAAFAGDDSHVRIDGEPVSIVGVKPTGSTRVFPVAPSMRESLAAQRDLVLPAKTARGVANALAAHWSATKLALKPGLAKRGATSAQRQAAYEAAMPFVHIDRQGGAVTLQAGALVTRIPTPASPPVPNDVPVSAGETLEDLTIDVAEIMPSNRVGARGRSRGGSDP